MAVATSRVTLVAMIGLHFLQRRMIFRRTSLVERRVISGKRVVQAVVLSGADVNVAAPANLRAVDDPLDLPFMRKLEIVNRFAAVTFGAIDV